MTHIKAIILSGLSWLGIGAFLTYKGLFYLTLCLFDPPAYFGNFLGSTQNVVLFLLASALIIGFLKGRFVLSKTAQRTVKSIILQPAPLKLKNIYSKGYIILIVSMMALGMLMRVLPIGNEVRGVIDTAVGFALMNGALIYFRLASILKHQKQDR